ncbi:Ada metal-binding domain-containing protein [Chitinophaga skermanii]|nr:Ada metal-binding domain-containing protein [Chitinophaga skermanii]
MMQKLDNMVTAQVSLGASMFAQLRGIVQHGFRYAGNQSLKIYGTLQCTSGKRMKPKNRVFFHSLEEAAAAGYRPCGHCMRAAYAAWKINKQNGTI